MRKTLTLRDVTFGITAFERPLLLRQLVHSILRNYPMASIIVADNGRQRALLPKNVRVLELPFDCGLSAARNALKRELRTDLLMLLEEDFLFLPETRIEPLIDVLNHDPEAGTVGGTMLSPSGQKIAYSMDLEEFRDTLTVRQSNHRQRITSSGTSCRICHMIWNFALFRKDMLVDHAWDESLKVGEHAPYFNEVRKAARWRVACCLESVFYHVPDQRSAEYRRHRSRAADMFQTYLKRHGLRRCVRIAPQPIDDPLPQKPNVIVLGVGHSGTTVLTKMLHRMGWEPGDADQRYAESPSVRRLNQTAITKFGLPRQAAACLRQRPGPWALKDPRFIWTLRYWLPIFAEMPTPPLLARIRRDSEQLKASYARRRVPVDLDAMLAEREQLCNRQYEAWPWAALTIEYEQLASAALLFDQTRFDPREYFQEPEGRHQDFRQDQIFHRDRRSGHGDAELSCRTQAAISAD